MVENERHGISILAVEDDMATREFLGLIINKKFPDISVYFAENGIRGVELFKAHTPEVVITDIVMPGMDGVEMSSMIKKIKPGIKLIVVTGYNFTSYEEEFGRIGANAFLTKPIDIKKLCAAIERCLKELETGDRGCGQ